MGPTAQRGQLLRSVVNLPGLIRTGGAFLQRLIRGVVMMTPLFANAWAGTTYPQARRDLLDALATKAHGKHGTHDLPGRLTWPVKHLPVAMTTC